MVYPLGTDQKLNPAMRLAHIEAVTTTETGQ